jgi:hypothetical protein
MTLPRVLRLGVVNRGKNVLLRLHVVDADKDCRHSGFLQDLVSDNLNLKWGGPVSSAFTVLYAGYQVEGLDWGRHVQECQSSWSLTTAEVSVRQTSKPRAKA